MKINNVVVIFGSEHLEDFTDLFINCINFVDVRIFLKYRGKSSFGQVMHLAGRIMVLYATHNRCGKHNVADRTEPDDKNFFQMQFFTKI